MSRSVSVLFVEDDLDVVDEHLVVHIRVPAICVVDGLIARLLLVSVGLLLVGEAVVDYYYLLFTPILAVTQAVAS